MRPNRIKRVSLQLVCALALPTSFAGCNVGDNEGYCCDTEPETVTLDFAVRAFHNTGTELTSEDVDDVVLFVYDEDLHFQKSVDAHVGQSVSIEVPAGMDIHVVGWGNLDKEMHDFDEPEVGEHLSDHSIDLRTHDGTRAPTPVHSPDDLFRGDVTVQQERQDGEFTMALSREVGSMTITIRGLRRGTAPTDDYSVVVHGLSTGIDFTGDQTGGDQTSYHPAGLFGGGGVADEYYVPVFNMLPSSGMQIDIYRGSELIGSVTTDSSGKYIHVGQGIQTNILIDFGGGDNASLGVSVSLTDWGEDELWREF